MAARFVAARRLLQLPRTPRYLAHAARLRQASPASREEAEAEERADKAAMAKLGTMQKLRFIVSKYGRVAVGLYATLGLTDFTLTYAAVRMGLDVQPLMDRLFKLLGMELTDYLSPHMGALFAAYAMHKILTPPRVILTASVTPSLARYLYRTYPGIFTRRAPPPPTPPKQ